MKFNKIGYFYAKLLQKVVTHTPETICKFYRRGGVKVGKIMLYVVTFIWENLNWLR